VRKIARNRLIKITPILEREMKNLLNKIREFKILVMKEENTWMWSLFAIFALIFTAFILLYFISFSEL
jgi:hypothetical protein